jgi:STE24 endopeptidase
MNVYLIVILVILIGDYLLDVVADVLNARHISTELPAEFRDYYDADKYKKAQRYLRDNTRFDVVADTVLTPVVIAFILLGGFNVVDGYARGFGYGPIVTGLIFGGILMLLSQIVHIPFSAYRTFVIEERYGFNRTTPSTFIKDILKKWTVGGLVGGIIFASVIWLFLRAGSGAWFYCWMVVAAFQLFFMYIAPAVILPLFNKFVPLEEGELKSSIERYAHERNFKLKGVYKMDASRRSTKTNAFFTGFGRFRRIVLFDTLIKRHTVDELVSVLAHEMGHYKKRHILVSLLILVAQSGLMFYILSWFINNRGLFDAFRMKETSVYASLLFFGFLYAPIETMISIARNKISRKHEFDADAYAVNTYGHADALVTALKKLSVHNLSNLTPHPLKVWLDYSHPPILRRIKALKVKYGG